MQSITFEQLNQEFGFNQWPEFTDAGVVDNIATLKFIVSPQLNYFHGHFPEQAVLPGVVQVHWAGELSRRLFSCVGFSELINVKFNGVILPEAAIKLSLTFRPKLNKVEFNYYHDSSDVDGQMKLSSGSISFQGGA